MPSFLVGRLLVPSCGRFPGPLRRLYLSSGGGVIAIMGYYVIRGISVFGVVRLELGQLVDDMVENAAYPTGNSTTPQPFRS